MTVNLPQADTSRLYLIEIRSAEGDAQIVKSNLAALQIGRDPSCTIVLPDKLVAPLQLHVEFDATQVYIRNESEAIGVEYFPTGIFVNGTVKHGRSRRKSAPDHAHSDRTDSDRALIPPGDRKPWYPDTTLAVGGYLLTLRRRAEIAASPPRRYSMFQVLQDGLLPDVDLMRPRLAGLNLQQLLRAWWLLAMLFTGGGIITYIIFRYLPMLRLVTP